VTTVAVHVLSQRSLPGHPGGTGRCRRVASRLASRREISGEIAARIDAAVRADICRRRIRRSRPPRCWARCMSRWSAAGAGQYGRCRQAARRGADRDAVGVARGRRDGRRARGLVVQAVLPTKTLVGA